MTDEERTEKRKAAAGGIFDDIWSHRYYNFVRECFGAYKLEFRWGLANWAYTSESTTAFGYTDWVHADEIDYETLEEGGDNGVYDRTMYAEDTYPVGIAFDIPDFCRAVRDYATAYDEDADGSEVMVRQEALDKLQIWQAAIDTLRGELEDELRIIRASKDNEALG